jgi:hypothetical protein
LRVSFADECEAGAFEFLRADLTADMANEPRKKLNKTGRQRASRHF